MCLWKSTTWLEVPNVTVCVNATGGDCATSGTAPTIDTSNVRKTLALHSALGILRAR
ncbi:MAG: hypothetical protein H6833_04000 [Planctomycetes bacterium]|nr:hypothetical protein [Planctomycetota bacterium]